MLVSVLASGSEGNCTYIQTKNKKILIDLGMTYKYITNELNELGVSPSDIDYLLVTHTHSDHTGAMKQFLKNNNPTIFITKEAIKELDFLADYDNVCYDDGEINFGDFIIETFNTSHDAPGSRGYIVKEDNESVVYITDTGYINQKLFKKLYNHSLYIFESNHDIEMLMHGRYPAWLKKRVSSDYGHLSNTQASFYLSKIIGDKTKQIVLAHLSKENNDPEIAMSTLKEYFVDNDIVFNNICTAKQRERVDFKV